MMIIKLKRAEHKFPVGTRFKQGCQSGTRVFYIPYTIVAQTRSVSGAPLYTLEHHCFGYPTQEHSVPEEKIAWAIEGLMVPPEREDSTLAT